MFKRWLILMAATLVLEFAAGAYLTKLVQNNQPIYEVCKEYLNTLPDTWTKASDTYYRAKCDLENPMSDQTRALNWQNKQNTNIGYIMVTFMATLGVFLLSFVARWLFVGRLW